MNKIIAITFGLLVAFQTQAADFCTGQREMAENMMSARQNGVSRKEIDAVVYSEQGQAIADMAFARGIVPQSVRKTAVKHFADYVEGVCRKNYNPSVAGTTI